MCRCRCRCCCRCRFRCPPCQSVVFVCLRENFHFRSGGNNRKCIQNICKGLTGFLHRSFKHLSGESGCWRKQHFYRKGKRFGGRVRKGESMSHRGWAPPHPPVHLRGHYKVWKLPGKWIGSFEEKTMHVVLPSGYSWISNVWHTENTYFCSWNVLNIFEITCPWKFRVTYIWSDISENHSFEESCPSKISLAISETNSLVWSKIKFDICVRHSISGRGQIKQKLFCRKETKWTLAPSSAGLSAMLSGLWDILSKIIKHQRRYGISQ